MDDVSFLFSMLDERNEGVLPGGAALVSVLLGVAPDATEAAAAAAAARAGAAVGEEAFGVAVRAVTIGRDPAETRQQLRREAKRLQAARRRRFLMYADRWTGVDVDQQALCLGMAGGPVALSMYRELFTFGAGPGAPLLPRPRFDFLLRTVCPAQPQAERLELLKVAAWSRDAFPSPEGVEFAEFVALMRGARLAVPLSDMVAAARRAGLAAAAGGGRVAVVAERRTREPSLPKDPFEALRVVRENFKRIAEREDDVNRGRRVIIASSLEMAERAAAGSEQDQQSSVSQACRSTGTPPSHSPSNTTTASLKSRNG